MDGPASVFNYDYQIVKLSEEFAFCKPVITVQPGSEQREKFWRQLDLSRYDRSKAAADYPTPS